MFKKICKAIACAIVICSGVGLIILKTEKLKGENGWSKGHKPKGIYERSIKRPMDFALALLALLMLWPIMIVVAVLVRIKLGSPMLFEQKRPGLNERVFVLYKFRTMTDKRDKEGNLLPDEERLTTFGKWLRSTSLDELPELINILKGDMSIVGPRPLLVEYLPRYNEKQKRRHDVRPGLTGYAQASGRNALSWEEKFENDVKYVDNITFVGDVKIIVNTVKSVLRHEGINSDTSVTMEKFVGNHDDDLIEYKE